MAVDLGDADAGVALGIWIIDDFLQELIRRGTIPTEYEFERPLDPTEDLADLLEDLLGDVLGPLDPPPLLRFNVTLDPPPVFGFVRPPAGEPYTRLTLDGTIEVRLAASDPTSPPLQTFPLHAPVLLALRLVAGDPLPVVGLRYEGTDGPPDAPVTRADVDAIFESPPIRDRLLATTIDLAATLVAGLNASRFPDEATRPADATWSVALTLLPARDGTDDAFFVTVGPPGTTAAPRFSDSFLRSRTGMGVAFSRGFLDLMLGRGAAAKVGEEVEGGATVQSLTLRMLDTAIEVEGHVKKVVTALPDVDIRFHGPMIPSLVRGTTVMAFDTDLVAVDVDDDDELFYEALKWFVTVASAGLLFTGVGSLTALGILSWVTLVQEVWNADVEIENAPGTLRDGLANALGAELSALADALDDDQEVDPLRVDATPDSLEVVDGTMLLYAQILLVPLRQRLRLAEYAPPLERFAIVQLNDGRRFRTQELARLVRAGKVTVPGLHEVDGRYVRANPDEAVANNLLQRFEGNPTNEVVL